MKVILNGGGDARHAPESFELFAGIVGRQKVMYIPLAWIAGDYTDCLTWFQQTMKPYGIENIDFITAPEQITGERLSEAGGVFIGGGNTFKLLKMLKETEAFNNLKEYLKLGGTVMGGSAGALIFGKSTEPCLKDDLNIKSNDENLVGLNNFSGFDICNGYSLFVHYKKKPEQNEQTKQKVKRLIKSGHKLICLPEETSLYINGKTFCVIGHKPAEIFDKLSSATVSNNETVMFK